MRTSSHRHPHDDQPVTTALAAAADRLDLPDPVKTVRLIQAGTDRPIRRPEGAHASGAPVVLWFRRAVGAWPVTVRRCPARPAGKHAGEPAERLSPPGAWRRGGVEA
jgi:hypothetical protein